jgi:hypothetical protein
MTVKQLIRELQNPPSSQIASVRIEFADGSTFEVSPDMNHRSIGRIPRNKKDGKIRRRAT